ncbi:MAG: hypothetical protein ACJ8AI_24010 [Rhodopila sp.]
MRQSIPSSSIESRAGVIATLPSAGDGQFGEQAQPLAIPPQNFQKIAAPRVKPVG